MVRIYIPGKLKFDTGINSQFCARFGVAKGGENNIPGELSSFLNKISDMAGVGDKDDLGKQKLCYSFRNEKKDKKHLLKCSLKIYRPLAFLVPYLVSRSVRPPSCHGDIHLFCIVTGNSKSSV